MCNKLPRSVVFELSGINQNGQFVSAGSIGEVRSCFTIRHFRWAVGQNVSVDFYDQRDRNCSGTFRPYIPSDARDGSTVTFDARF